MASWTVATPYFASAATLAASARVTCFTAIPDCPIIVFPFALSLLTKTSPRMMSRAVRSSAACRTSVGFAGFMVSTTLNSPLGCSTEMRLGEARAARGA